jgi:hypothetical protein
MKKSRCTEEQIIAVLKEVDGEAAGRHPQARRQRAELLRLEVGSSVVPSKLLRRRKKRAGLSSTSPVMLRRVFGGTPLIRKYCRYDFRLETSQSRLQDSKACESFTGTRFQKSIRCTGSFPSSRGHVIPAKRRLTLAGF